MNKKGFTMIELIACIAIIAMLAAVILPGFMSIRKKVLTNSLNDKIKTIEIAGEEFGSDHIMDLKSPVSNKYYNGECYDNNDNIVSCKKSDCLYGGILVKKLIFDGYLVGDSKDKKILTNPLTDKNLNNAYVCIRYDINDAMNRKIVSYVIDKEKLFE